MIDKKRELFFFLVSGILHAAFIYWILHAHMDVKVFVPKREITEVVIVSSGTLRSPILKPQLSTTPPQVSRIPQNQDTPVSKSSPLHKTKPATIGAPSPQFKTDEPRLQVLSPHNTPFSINLNLSLATEPGAETDYKKILEDLKVEDNPRIYNLSRHLSHSAPPGNPDELQPQVSSGNSKGYFNIKRFDIKPWAQRVINRVNNQWSIPLALKVGATGIVGVKTTFKKNGEITSLSIEQRSGLTSLDQSAQVAVEQSAPFPALPDGFPHETLEVYFVFEYGT